MSCATPTKHPIGVAYQFRQLVDKVGNSSQKLLPQALSEGLPMIRPGAVDICRPVMVRYSVIYGVTR
jgi:hypothetical protein